MNRVVYDNFAYIENFKPHYSSNPPSPATSELDCDSRAPFNDSLCAMDCDREMPPYAQALLTHATDARRTSNVSSDVNRSARSSKRVSRSSKMHSEQADDGHVILEKRVVRALLLYLRETRLRLHENETKLHNMEKAMASFQKNHEQQMLILAKSFVCLQNQLAEKKTSLSSDVRQMNETSETRPQNTILEKNVETTESYDVTPTQLQKDDVLQGLDKLVVESWDRDHNYNRKNSVVKPLYAVVKKKQAASLPVSPPFPPPPEKWANDSLPLPISSRTSSLDLSYSEESSLDKDSSRLDSQSSVQSHEQINELSSLSENVVADPSTSSNLPQNNSLKDHKKYRPLPERPVGEVSDPSPALAKRYSGDGYYISSANRRRSSGRYETVGDVERLSQAQNYTPLTRPKGSQLFSRFKKKLKDTKRIVSKATSKDSLASELSLAPDAYFDDRLNVSVASGSVGVFRSRDDGNNNNSLFRPDDVALQQTAYLAKVQQQTQIKHRRLDSTGDNDSRSTDTSDMQINENATVSLAPPSSGLYRQFQSQPLANSSQSRWLAHKAPSSPDLSRRQRKSPVRRSSSLDAELRLNDSPRRRLPDPPSATSSQTTIPSEQSLTSVNVLLSSEDSLTDQLENFG